MVGALIADLDGAGGDDHRGSEAGGRLGADRAEARRDDRAAAEHPGADRGPGPGPGADA
jgi:hypothetical protein